MASGNGEGKSVGGERSHGDGRPDGGTATGGADGVDLDYPSDDWAGFFRNHFGPSMLWALIGIGGSHIVLGPTMGATFGLFAIWVFAFIYLVKYGAWELGIRYNYGIGGNPVEAYDQLPGPANWMQWYTLGVFVIGYAAITAGVGLSSAALVSPLVPLSVPQTFVVLVGIAGVLVIFARYTLLEKILLGFTIVLGILLVLGAVVGPPSLDVVAETAISPDLGGERTVVFVGLFAAAAGFAPTGFSTSVLIGSWSTAKGEGANQLRDADLDPDDERYHDYIRQWIRTGRRDFNIGYAFSFLLVAAMIVLSSNVLYPNPLDDANFAYELGQVLSDSFGEWSFWAMLVGGFAALYSTVITLLDGASRAAGDISPMVLGDRSPDNETVRRAVVLTTVVASSVVVLALGNVPVTFVVTVAAILAVTESLFYPANWYVVKKNLPEAFQPSRTWVAYYALSLLAVVVFGLMGAAAQLDLVPELLDVLR
ncbi:Mn2+/Fe2_ transporter, NRAMP family [Halovivax ruber XH-70]|uniref:Mn2+/Fe2_transporter, NRAMP family n=1 Tax=Halovivax ruber (strain DSM 18193 / JCM 13892 / XH-70) TaxID=797302 RepID=L0I9Q1_HALRX|nr:Nramp family divalent metal transporter [Halovivax ruber]AGB14692.1 Mn2+/Fe2_ transporter, NRAMP family [Halovivax ruber XH-70]